MGRTLENAMASLPDERRERIQARAAEMAREVEGLKALRKLELRVELPGTGPLTLTGVGEMNA